MVPLAFGTQTAASLIRPASYCGVFALKPTHGGTSLAGIKPFAPSLDTLGWMARSADDLELMRAAMTGEPFRPLDVLDASGLRLRASRTHEWPQIDDGGAGAWDEALARIARGGRAAEVVDLPAALAGLTDAQKTVMAREAAHHLAAELRDHRERLSAPLIALLDAGCAIDAQRYDAALACAAHGRALVADLMRDVDALLVPAAPGEAPRGLHATGDPAFSRVWTLLGLPCVTVPGLVGPNGLPIGMQVVGHPGDERRLLRAAATLHRLLAGGVDA
jgi:Asp-tRNA(Asn)/Glu-tRNA(Gln) amidotransferase A subunit family amidase